LSPNTVVLFSIARSRKLSANDVDGYQSLYQHHHNGAWKTAMLQPMGYRSSSDRDLTQEDVEEETTKEDQSTPTTNHNIDDLIIR
jgi:hypothetical protein